MAGGDMSKIPEVADAAAGQIKIGSLRNSERLTKYNRLSRIETDGLPFARFSAPKAGRG